MALGVAAGYPQLAGVVSPELWSPKLNVKYYLSTVFHAISNASWEGEIRQRGDTVHIRETPDITIFDVVKGQDLNYENPEPTTVDLVVDQAKGYAFNVEDVDRFQSDYEYLEDWTEDAGFQMGIAVDTNVLAYMQPLAHASNKGATAGADSGDIDLGATGAPVVLTKDNIIDYVIDCSTVLDEQNVPDEGRWMVLPPWTKGLIQKSDLRDASVSGDGTSIARNGRLGVIGDFTLYRSRSLVTTADSGNTVTSIMFGHNDATTFASQIIQNQGPFMSERGFFHRCRGLNVFGRKTTKDVALGELYAIKG